MLLAALIPLLLGDFCLSGQSGLFKVDFHVKSAVTGYQMYLL